MSVELTDLVLFRNELKNKIVPKYKMIGIVSSLLMSKEIFSNNTKLAQFLKEVFQLECKSYIFRSRSLLAARVTRELLSLDDDQGYKRKLYDFIQTQIELSDPKKTTKRNIFDGWL